MEDKTLLDIAVYTMKLIDQTINDDEFERLNSLILSDTQAARHYNQLMMAISNFQERGKEIISDEASNDSVLLKEFWDSLAACEKDAQSIIVVREEMPREPIQKESLTQHPKRKNNKFQFATLVISMAAMFAFILLVKYMPPRPYSTAVATVVDQLDPVWESSTSDMDIGSRLWTNDGNCRLHKGIVKVQFDCGTEVIVEGPAEFELTGATRMFIHSGRFYAVIPNRAAAFTAVTPTAEVIDMGTEFGIKVISDGTTEVHMVRGRASLIAEGCDSGYELTQGQAARVLQGRLEIEAIPFQQKEFTAYIPSPYERYAMSLNPFCYLSFDQYALSPLTDKMQMEEITNYRQEKIAWIKGPDLGEGKTSSAVHFSGVDVDGMFVDIPVMDERKGFTYSLWVRPESVGESVIFVMQSVDGTIFREIGFDAGGQFQQITRKAFGGNELLQMNPAKSKIIPQIGQWYHVAVTSLWGENKIIYINGELENKSSSKVGSYSDNEMFNKLYIGKAPDRYSKQTSGFAGSVCEVVIYNRVLSDKEIQRLYQSTKMSTGN